MIDPVDIINEFTRYDPTKGQPPLELPIPGYWFKKICSLADRIAKAENELRKWRTGEIAGIEFVPVFIATVEAQRDAAMAQGELMRNKIAEMKTDIECLRDDCNAAHRDARIAGDEVSKMRESINRICLYSVDDEHDYSDIERICRTYLEDNHA